MTRNVTPAFINYTSSTGSDTTVAFHSVFTESHEASTEITKYPVQTGFIISNHAIRKNRVVKIEALVTNTVLAGTRTSNVTPISANISRDMFKQLEDVVNNSTVCKVTTNLGIYNDVVFNHFSTTQMEGMVDAMKFTISGEELQVRSSLTKSAPFVVVFSKLPPATEIAQQQQLEKKSIAADGEVTTSTVQANRDFQVTTKGLVGEDIITTYVFLSENPTTGASTYEVHTNNTELAANAGSEFNIFSLVNEALLLPEELENILQGGISSTAACLKEGINELLSGDGGDDSFISTAFGKLRKSIHGAFLKVISILPGSGNPLISLGRDCLITALEEVEGVVLTPVNFFEDEVTEIATVDNILNGARNIGIGIASSASPVVKDMLLTKISSSGAGINV